MVIKIELLGSGADRRTYTFDKNVVTIGRSPENDLVIDSSQVSKHHCRVIRTGDRLEIEDLKSTNGTRINGQVITRATIATGEQFIISFAVPPLKITLEESLGAGDLGFFAPPNLQGDESATVVGQITLDEEMRQRIARKNVAKASAPPSQPVAPPPPPTVPVSPATTERNPLLWVALAVVVVIVIAVIVFTQGQTG